MGLCYAVTDLAKHSLFYIVQCVSYIFLLCVLFILLCFIFRSVSVRPVVVCLTWLHDKLPPGDKKKVKVESKQCIFMYVCIMYVIFILTFFSIFFNFPNVHQVEGSGHRFGLVKMMTSTKLKITTRCFWCFLLLL